MHICFIFQRAEAPSHSTALWLDELGMSAAPSAALHRCSSGALVGALTAVLKFNIVISADVDSEGRAATLPAGPVQDKHHVHMGGSGGGLGWGGLVQQAINGPTDRLALAFSFKEPPAGHCC